MALGDSLRWGVLPAPFRPSTTGVLQDAAFVTTILSIKSLFVFSRISDITISICYRHLLNIVLELQSIIHRSILLVQVMTYHDSLPDRLFPISKARIEHER